MTAVMWDTEVLKLHTAADGTVWFANGNRVPIASGVRVDDFVRTLPAAYCRHFRMLGSHTNARLITLLHQTHHGHGPLEVASPLICGKDHDRCPIEALLHRMRDCGLPPSLGGWHSLSQADYPAYAMVSRMQSDGRFNNHILALLSAHPAWHALKFLQTISADWSAWVLSFIIDPRWYINPECHSRVSKLQAYMGLTPEIMQRVHAGTHVAGAPARCRAVLGAWFHHTPPTEEHYEHPGNFLWRIYRQAGCGVRGQLRACQKFITYLRHTWLQALYPQVDLFLPEMFFKTPHEIEAYKAHAALRGQSV